MRIVAWRVEESERREDERTSPSTWGSSRGSARSRGSWVIVRG